MFRRSLALLSVLVALGRYVTVAEAGDDEVIRSAVYFITVHSTQYILLDARIMLHGSLVGWKGIASPPSHITSCNIMLIRKAWT